MGAQNALMEWHPRLGLLMARVNYLLQQELDAAKLSVKVAQDMLTGLQRQIQQNQQRPQQQQQQPQQEDLPQFCEQQCLPQECTQLREQQRRRLVEKTLSEAGLEFRHPTAHRISNNPKMDDHYRESGHLRLLCKMK